MSEWESFWSSFNITINTTDQELSRTIQASLYAIVSALPAKRSSQLHDELFYGLSPTGLGRGGSQLSDYEGTVTFFGEIVKLELVTTSFISFEGHNFWDTETWMFPAVLAMDADWSRQLLAYRYAKLEAARDFARECNYEGAR